MRSEERPIVIIGGGGHARVLADACERAGLKLAGILAPVPPHRTGKPFAQYLGTDALLDDPDFVSSHRFVIGVGENAGRQRIGGDLSSRGAELTIIFHPSSVIGAQACIGDGGFVAAGAVVGAGAILSRHVIVNTLASVDHEVELGSYCQIGPGAHLAGEVVCGDAVVVGTGASVRPGVRIGSGTIVGAGAAVISDLPPGIVAVGCPAKPRSRGMLCKRHKLKLF